MRAGGLAGLCALGVGVVVFGLESARAPAQEVSHAPGRRDEAPAPRPLTVVIERQAQHAAPPPRTPTVSQESEAAAPRAQEASRTWQQVAPPAPPPPSTRRSRSWRRSYNRYPGRIPTPAEWEPPAGPVRIALQAGHWRADEAPGELRGLRDNGTSWRGTAEWEVNLAIARSAASLLEEMGYEVDVLPAVVPPDYRAHLFVAIHADGSDDPNARGFRVASPSRDATGRAARFASLLERSYGEETELRRLPDSTRRMRNYYAFNYRRYEHALHPMTIGVILETGFLTSASDRRVILENPERSARGIVEAIAAFDLTPPPALAAGR